MTERDASRAPAGTRSAPVQASFARTPAGKPVSSEPELPRGAAGPVAATVTRRVKPGHEAAY
jgi:hypothetical protein